MSTSPAILVVVGSIWESRHGNHGGGKQSNGLRVQVTYVREHNVQVKLLGGGGFSKTRAENKGYYTIGMAKFLNRYSLVSLPKVKRVVDPVTAAISQIMREKRAEPVVEQPVPEVEKIEEVAILAEPVMVEEPATKPVEELAPTRDKRRTWAEDQEALDAWRQKMDEANQRAIARLSENDKVSIMTRLADKSATYGELAREYHMAVSAIALLVRDARAAAESEGMAFTPAPNGSLSLADVPGVQPWPKRKRKPMSEETRESLRGIRRVIMERELARLTDAEKAEIVALRRKDPPETLGEIARAYKVSIGTVGRVIGEGIPVTERRASHNAKRRASYATERFERFEYPPAEVVPHPLPPEPLVIDPVVTQQVAEIVHSTDRPLRQWTVRRLVMKPVEETITVEAESLVDAVSRASKGCLELLSINPVD